MNTPKSLTDEDVEKFLAYFELKRHTTKQKQKLIRNHCICLLMLDAGLRIGEVIQLKPNDLVFNSNPMKSIILSCTITKNRKMRTIPVSVRLSKVINLMHWAYWYNYSEQEYKYAFTTRDRSKPMSRRAIEYMIEIISLATLGRSINPHMLRHTFATRLMKITNIRTVQELLGHSSLTSTQIYTHPSENDKADAIKKMDLTPC